MLVDSLRSGLKGVSHETRTFAPGARVVIRDEEWIVRGARATSTGGTAVHCTGLSELVRNKDAIFLTDLDDVVELRPEETQLVADPTPRYRRSRLYLESLLRQSPPTDNRLYIGHKAAIQPTDYQLSPARLALEQARPRILIADAVGLGKTIEVGILLSELMLRGRGRRILVVTLKSILAQFQLELWTRFSIPLVRLDSVGLQRVQAKLPASMNPFYHFNRVIISIDTLKRDEKYRRYLEACHWDAIVIDECQHVAVRGQSNSSNDMSQRARLASLLGRTCDALILTSATPHDGRAESFASLMNLLEPTAVANPSDYSAEDVKGLFVRRFKKDVANEVGEQFSERELVPHHVVASVEEEAVFQALETLELRTVDRNRRTKGVLFKTTLLKSFLSSPQALMATVNERLKKGLNKDDDDTRHDHDALTHLNALAARVGEAKFSKLTQLGALLRGIGAQAPNGPKVVIFSERIATLELLEEHLKRTLKLKDAQVAVFHGTLDDVEQRTLVEDFGSAKGDVRLLLASDAAAEGINLHHFCHQLVHFDIPWSLITLEQRNGRIDRFGQHQTPFIHTLLTTRAHEAGATKGRADLRVLDRLIEKEQMAHKNLGDVAWLMNLHSAEAEEERIGLALERGEAPESVIPDAPAQDLLAILMGQGAAPEVNTRAESPSLFDDDLAFAREAFAQLHDDDQVHVALADQVTPPEWHDGLRGFTVYPSPDLARRFDSLPPEMQGRDGAFKLTVERKRIESAYEEARQGSAKDDALWPEWQLFWPLHPIAEWLNDRTLALFRRHEAPVVRATRGLAPNERAFVVQGVLSNRRSQPVLVQWWAAVARDTTRGPEDIDLVPFEDFVQRCGLQTPSPNPGALPLDALGLDRLLPLVVQSAHSHMATLRAERGKSLGALLRDEQRRVKRWHETALAQVDDAEAHVKAHRALRKDEEQRFAERRQELDRRMASRETWIREGLETVVSPYVRVAGVWVG